MKLFYSKLCMGCIILILFSGTLVFASDKDNAEKPKSPFFSDFLWQWNEVEKKLKGLAEAIPQEKYTWRPEEGVRSVSEVVAHVAGGNFYIPSFIGVDPPEGFSPEMEKSVTDKTKLIDALTQSFEHFRKVILSKSDEDLDAPAELFGNKTTVRNAFFLLLSHTHEHLGQLIAYARMNDVVPPWSAKQSEQKEE